MGTDWSQFRLPSDRDSDSPRCEMCELIVCTYVTGVEQLLHLALWLDRTTRFGKTEELPQIVARIQAHREEVEKSLQNYLRHQREGHPS